MPALRSLKSNRARAKTALPKEEEEENQRITELNDDKVMEIANEKLMDAHEQNEDTKLEVEFQDTLDEDTELADVVIDKLLQLRMLKEEGEKRRRFTNSR